MAKATKPAETPKKDTPLWTYYKVDFLLVREFLGTLPEASIYEEHVIAKAKKEIKRANALKGRITKALEKYKGVEISDAKEIAEIKGIIMSYAELTGKPRTDLPNTKKELKVIWEEVEAEFEALIKAGDELKGTIFMKYPKHQLGVPLKDGEDENTLWPVVSTHMVLGNLKENLKIITNNGDKSIIKTKVGAAETLALDVKAVEEFMIPSEPIKMVNGDGQSKRELLERVVRFKDNMGKETTAINLSETLPPGTEMSCTLRVRTDGPFSEQNLRKLFKLGINNGFGQWRGSGNKGAYRFKLVHLPDYQEDIPEGWE